MGKPKVYKVVPVVGGMGVVMAAPLVMLPEVPGELLASVMATGVVMVFAGLAHDLLPGRTDADAVADTAARTEGGR